MSDERMTLERLLAENNQLKQRLKYLEREVNNSKLLKKSEKFLMSVLNNSPAAMIICEAPDGRVSYINDAVWSFRGNTNQRLTGITVEEYVNSWTEYYPDGKQYTGKEMPIARSLLHGEIVKNEQLIVELEDGTQKWIAASSAPIYDDDKKIIAAIVIFHDITEYKLLEESLQKNKAYLTQLNNTKDKFFTLIAHDLKSPFNSILGFSNLIAEDLKNKDYSDIENYAQIIQEASLKTLELLSNLFEWAKSQTNKLTLNLEVLDLKELINNTVALAKYAAQQKSISITVNIATKTPIYTDKTIIETIIRNLVSNAIKYTYKNGKIVISASKNQNEHIITVTDNGVGIKNENLNKLFKISESISTCGTQNERGTGLGLIICKEFVEKLNGKIQVTSESGNGSTFTITLPIRNY
ncbi:PAS domain-containing sensor histidine kinase [Wenyingzhuangia aestuarii]|uniref:PAS domain-containing sensor histidine kinase n=1 Tax=Wenyingzhuangia aestuarii TaxID=1647582 RepID=UPI001439D40E|nr:ATP-binding protein [Wenyingzhuangia aestuarii]NJB81888.1 PAS domain S-box-containing protein [Wenyingzhuangia aestuarii]